MRPDGADVTILKSPLREYAVAECVRRKHPLRIHVAAGNGPWIQCVCGARCEREKR